MTEDLEKNYNEITEILSGGNDRGEKITLLAATKFVDIGRINEAIALGVTAIGENRAQEFRDKFSLYSPCEKHFIGTLQENKLKYVVGKADCIDSVSSPELARAIGSFAEKLGIRQNVMLEINSGEETSKTGAAFSDAISLYKSIIGQKELKLTGIMAMLPETEDESLLSALADKTRALYDKLKSECESLNTLSMGMTGDYKLAIKHGSNMVRIGTGLFGKRTVTACT